MNNDRTNTYSPGDALLGNGRRVTRGETGAVLEASKDLRGNNGDAVLFDVWRTRELVTDNAGDKPLCGVFNWSNLICFVVLDKKKRKFLLVFLSEQRNYKMRNV